MIAGGGAQKLLENHAGAESMRFVVLASKIKVRRAWDTLDVEGQPGVASGCSPGVRGVAGHGACGRSLPCLWPQPPTARIIAGALRRGRGRGVVAGPRARRALTGRAHRGLYDDGELELQR